MAFTAREKHPIYLQKSPWETNGHNVWLATTVSSIRNIAKYKFPSKLEKSRQEQIVTLIYESIKGCDELKNPHLFKSEDLGPLEKEFLLEHFLVTDSFHQAHGGEGFLIDDSGSFLGVINLQNHLQLQFTDTQQEIEKTWNRLLKIEECLGKSIDFAFNPRFGYLTSDPAMSGTGLIIRLYLHIPAIIHSGELPEVIEKDSEEEIIATGIQGSASEMIGDIIVGQNSCTLGVTEEYLLTSLRMWATKVVIAEIGIRKKLMQSGDEHIKNRVARALGLLTHSYQLEVIEALNALSLVKLGLELGWIHASEPVNINQILFNTRRAHLLNLLGSNIPVPQLPRKRAEYLHDVAKKLALAI